MDFSQFSVSSSICPSRPHCPMSVAEQSSDVRVGGLVPIDARRDNECIDIAETRSLTEPLERYFLSGSPLCPVELLMYALMRIQFKKSPAFVFSRHHSMFQYNRIVEAVSKMYGVQFEASSIRRFFPRITNNSYA